MTPKERGERAAAYFLDGYNCPQSVVLAFSDLLGMDETLLTKMVSPFGGGICRIREVCGAVSGMMFVLGSLEGYTSPEDNEGKAALYYTGQTLVKKFTERNGKGSFICADILDKPRGADIPQPELRTENYYHHRPCAEIVRAAAEVLSEYLGQ